jgi:hypothetical protein
MPVARLTVAGGGELAGKSRKRDTDCDSDSDLVGEQARAMVNALAGVRAGRRHGGGHA